MRLKKVRIAGFKSFVDPVDILLPSHLIAIVGPNGCGKSNIVDAVRWVLGESSARYLRSEQLSDVIFNGSSHRKPVGACSVELVFDNTDGTLAGQYSQYSEISVKRMVTREDKSAYYLNGTRCRRKDITDLFLGAGLSARSYAIIEQGIVSKLTEAQPEELRAFLEVSAGIAQYKERRRETELRIQHTQTNLNRLRDIQAELDKQLQKLNSQAKDAQKYQQLHQEKKLRQAQLYAIQWQRLDGQYQSTNAAVTQFNAALEQKIKRKDQLERETQDCHQSYQSQSQEVISIQQDYYQLGAEIVRLEEKIQNRKQRYHDLEEMQEQYRTELAGLQVHMGRDQDEIKQTTQAVSQLNTQIEQEKINYEQAQAKLVEKEQALKDCQKVWDHFYESENEKIQMAQTLQLKYQLLQQRKKDNLEQTDQLNHEQSNINSHCVASELKSLRTAQIELEEQQNHFKQSVQQIEQVITQYRYQLQLSSEKIDGVRTKLNKLDHEFSTVNAVQQIALGKQEDTTSNRFNDQAIDQELRQQSQLAQTLIVEPGWELAVETILGDFLKAVHVDDFKKYIPNIADPIQGTLVLTYQDDKYKSLMIKDNTTLMSKVQNRCQLVEELLNKVYITENIEQALKRFDHLEPGYSVITKDGIWLGRNWLKIIQNHTGLEGVVKRESQLKQIQASMNKKSIDLEDLMLKQTQMNHKLNEQLGLFDEQKTELDQVSQKLIELKTQIEIKNNTYLSAQARGKDINRALTEHHQSLQRLSDELKDIKAQIESDTQAMEKRNQEKEILKKKRADIGQLVDTDRHLVSGLRESKQQLEFQHKLTFARIKPMEENLARNERSILRLQQSYKTGEDSLSQMSSPSLDLQQKLANKKDEQTDIKSDLAQSQSSVAQLKEQISDLEQKRTDAIEQVQILQKKCEDLRVEQQTIKTQRDAIQGAISHGDDREQVNLADLVTDLPQDVNETDWISRLRTIDQRIQRMGAINLAAVDELQQCSERKDYLDQQHQDLTNALSTLQEAIEKIDQESRLRLTEVYEGVNQGFSTIFSRLFGGGEAHLEIAGKDLLDSGITVVARPPGKTNRRVQSLSGGEKALTALALIFAIFQLKPSPFCILDEVDAPLDDVNVLRFCDLVKEMSTQVQFVLITHNKVTMGLAKQLTGVTMNEPGVSRIVSVDIDTAVSLAET